MTLPHVTDAERPVLEALWRLGPLPPARLISEVKSGRDWGDSTIKTLIARLMHKQALQSRRDDGVLRYHPLFSRDAFAENEVRSLVASLFDGDAQAFLVFSADILKR